MTTDYAKLFRNAIMNSRSEKELRNTIAGIKVVMKERNVVVDSNMLNTCVEQRTAELTGKEAAKISQLVKCTCPECNGTGIWKKSVIKPLPCFKCHSTGFIMANAAKIVAEDHSAVEDCISAVAAL